MLTGTSTKPDVLRAASVRLLALTADSVVNSDEAAARGSTAVGCEELCRTAFVAASAAARVDDVIVSLVATDDMEAAMLVNTLLSNCSKLVLRGADSCNKTAKHA